MSDGEAKLLQGSVRLLSAAYDSDPEGYLIEIRSGTSEWARQVAAEMFNTLGISFSGRLTPTMIRQTWTNNTPVKFFPVCRDEYTPELSSVELIPVERFLSVDDYHPFISAATVVQTLFSEAGYTLESDFLNGEFFRSLYLSGAYSSRDTNALRNRMDFLARRTTTAATTANSDGRVYANPYKSINSVGNFVETVNPNDQNDLGETLTDVFSNNHCFTVEDGEIVFRPMTSVTVAFEYHIRYITDHRILDRNRLKGIDSFYLGDGTEVQGALANRYADRRNSTKPAFQYRAIVFNHTEGNSYRLTCTVNGTAGHAIGEFDSRSALVTTPSGSTVTAPVLLYKAAGSTTYTTYTGDWALYDGYIGETGQTEVEMTVRTNPVTVTPTSPKTFSTIYFYGAEPGMKFSLSRQCTLRPDFTGAPGLNTPISFEDVARHRVRKWVVLDALRHLFNLRFYTDEETRTVYVEPADDFYRLGQTFDWSSRIDRSQPILLGDAAQDAERVRIYKYREADGAVTRLNATLEEPFGQWRLVNDSAAAIDRERNLANPFFSPTVSETECYADAPSALVLRVGDRDAPDTTDRNSFTPRIVRYCGMRPCPPASAGAILPPETATPWPHSTVTIPTTGSRSASKTGTDNRDCTASTTPRPNRRNAASTSRSTCGSNRATSNGSFRYSASPPASPRRSCSASAAKRSAARSAASRVTTPRPPRPAAPSPVCPTDSPSTVLHPRGPQPYDSPHSHGMHSSKIRPTLLPERGRRETATIPPTANPIPNAGERAGKKQLSMQSDIQITNRNDTCFVDIEGVIGVPEEWQFDQPSSRVATYEKFRDSLDRLARNRRPGNRRQYPLDGRRRKRRPADLRGPLVARRTHRHPLLRLYGFGGHSHRTGRIGGMPRNIGPRPLPDPQFDLHRRRQCRRACDPHRPAPQNRRTPGGGLCRPFWPHSGGVHPPDGRKQRLRPLALSAGGTRRRTRRSDHRTLRHGKNACGTGDAGRTMAQAARQAGTRPSGRRPSPRPQHPPFRRPGKRARPPHFGTRPARRPAIRGSDPHAPPRRSVDRRNDSLGQPAGLCRRCEATDPVKPARRGSDIPPSDTLRKTATPEPIPFVRTTHSITKNQIIS